MENDLNPFWVLAGTAYVILALFLMIFISGNPED